MTMRPLVNLNGSWVEAIGIYAKSSNVWLPVHRAWIKENGEWKQFYPNFTPGTVLLTYGTPGTYTYTIPPGVFSITINAVGAGGGSLAWHDGGYGTHVRPGGPGGGIQNLTLNVVPHDVLQLVVGTGGGPGGYCGEDCIVYGSAGTDTTVSNNGATILVANAGVSYNTTPGSGTIYQGSGSVVHGTNSVSADGADVGYSIWNYGVGYAGGPAINPPTGLSWDLGRAERGGWISIAY